jgi:hypothetical protein
MWRSRDRRAPGDSWIATSAFGLLAMTIHRNAFRSSIGKPAMAAGLGPSYGSAWLEPISEPPVFTSPRT